MSVNYPIVIYQPFADTGDKNTIPNTPSPTPGRASYEDGFPPITRIRIQDGGLPPAGKDFNGVLNDVTQHTVWVESGGSYKFDATFATSIGGYSKGMVLQNTAGTSNYISLIDNNSVDFNSTPSSIGVQWGVYAGAAGSNTTASVSTTGGSTTLTTNQAAADIIIVTGTLVSNATIVFPAVMDSWRIINSTTGAFSLVAKAPTGQSLTCTQGKTNTVFYDGTQLQFPEWDQGLDSPALRGVPTAPTAAPSTNTTQLASTAFVTDAVSTVVAGVSAQYINGTFTAGSIGDLWTDTSAGPFTITLPDPPIGKNIITFRDIFGTWTQNNLTINPGSKTVLGVAGNLIANAAGRTFGMWYDTANTTWKLI